MIRKYLITCSFILFSSLLPAQDHWEEYEDEDTVRFFIGANINVLFPNHNTAVLYSGQPNVTPFNIPFILNDPVNQPIFDQFFRGPYQVAEYPFESRYRNAVELGLHSFYRLNEQFSVFLDFNVAQIDYEQFVTIQDDDPNNNIPGPTLLRFPLIGEENRFNLNLGFQYYYYRGEGSRAFVSLFGNANNISVQSNYVVIDERRYDIFHLNNNSADLQPGGNGYGAGFGLGFQFDINETMMADLHYQLTSAQVNLTEIVSERGLQNTLGIRVLWGL
jgi:hypothetical protein